MGQTGDSRGCFRPCCGETDALYQINLQGGRQSPRESACLTSTQILIQSPDPCGKARHGGTLATPGEGGGKKGSPRLALASHLSKFQASERQSQRWMVCLVRNRWQCPLSPPPTHRCTHVLMSVHSYKETTVQVRVYTPQDCPECHHAIVFSFYNMSHHPTLPRSQDAAPSIHHHIPSFSLVWPPCYKDDHSNMPALPWPPLSTAFTKPFHGVSA